LYLRISKNESDDRSLGTMRQEEDCRAEAARRGWQVIEPVYLDDDRSAFSGKARPAYQRMVEDLKAGVIDAVVVWHEDRLLRSMTEPEDLVILVEATGALIVTVTAGDVDLETPEGRLRARIQAAVARKESEDKSRRLVRKMAQLAGDGKSLGGRPPYGYIKVGYKGKDPAGHDIDTRTFEVAPEQARVVSEIISRVAAGETLTRIADDLNERGEPTSRGARAGWTISIVRRIALNGRYAGRMMHHGKDVGPSSLPAIVDEATWRQAVAILSDPARAHRRAARRYLLSGGLLVCGRCGTIMQSKPCLNRQGEYRATYVCAPKNSVAAGCGTVSIDANGVEAVVSERAISWVEDPAFAATLRRKMNQTSKGAVSASELDARIEAINDQFARGRMSQAAYAKALDTVAEQMSQLQASLTSDTASAAVGRYAGRKGLLRQEWPEMALDRRQAILRALMVSVEIAPRVKGGTNRFDPSRVGEPVWR
jgi:DNA invertase Pin-like site-specific DNA recombinase